MKNKKIGITILILFITITTSMNIVSLNKSSKLIGSSIGDIKYTDYLKASNVDYTSKKTVQDAIDEIYASASESFLDRMYPKGSIYISTSLSTKEEVAKQLGGEWESYGSGKTLVGVNTSDSDFSTVSKSGGSKSESYTPAGKNTGGKVENHTLTVSEIPSHSHSFKDIGFADSNTGTRFNFTSYGAGRDVSTSIATNSTGGGGAHNHPFTQPTFTGTQATISHMQPYITVYMYKRVD